MSAESRSGGPISGQQTLGGQMLWQDREAMAHHYHERGLTVARIADEVCDGQIDEGELRHRLSEYGVLDPWDDPSWLEAKYCDEGEGLTIEEIAEDELGGARTTETIRNRLHEFGLIDEFAGYSVDGESIEAASDALDEVPVADDQARVRVGGSR